MEKSTLAKKQKTPEEIELLKQQSQKLCKEFINFYRNNLDMTSDDYEKFIKCNESDLPVVFRVNQMR